MYYGTIFEDNETHAYYTTQGNNLAKVKQELKNEAGTGHIYAVYDIGNMDKISDVNIAGFRNIKFLCNGKAYIAEPSFIKLAERPGKNRIARSRLGNNGAKPQDSATLAQQLVKALLDIKKMIKQNKPRLDEDIANNAILGDLLLKFHHDVMVVMTEHDKKQTGK